MTPTSDGEAQGDEHPRLGGTPPSLEDDGSPAFRVLGAGPTPATEPGAHRSGCCSTDSFYLMSTTLVCDASSAATVMAGLAAGKC